MSALPSDGTCVHGLLLLVQLVPTLWLYRNKFYRNERLTKYKTRLVTQGFFFFLMKPPVMLSNPQLFTLC